MKLNNVKITLRSMTGRTDDLASCIAVYDGHEWQEKEGKFNKNKTVYHTYRCKGNGRNGEKDIFFDVKVDDVKGEMAEQVQQEIKMNGTVDIEFIEFSARAYAFLKEGKLIAGVSAKAKAVNFPTNVIV